LLHQLKLLVALMALLPSAARATDVIGNLNTNTRWTLAGSPYRLTGDVTVGTGATLTIEPGVVVEAAAADGLGSGTDTARVEFIIRGAIVADGTASAPVTFRGASATAGSWYGIVVETTAQASSISQATIQHGLYGVVGRSLQPVTLADITISSGVNGVFWRSRVGPRLQRVAVRGGTVGIELQDDGTNGAAASLDGCTVLGTSNGVVVRDRVNVTVANTTVRESAAVGILLMESANATVERSQLLLNQVGLDTRMGSSLVFRNNVVAGNLKGLDLSQAPNKTFSLINNTIDGNTGKSVGVYVRAVATASAFIIRNNHITNHGTIGLQVESTTPPTVDYNNAWGNAANYQGVTAGAGSISLNPLYESPITIRWNFVSRPISVSNPGHNFLRSWTFAQPNALRMRLVVTSMDTEVNWDWLRVIDQYGATVDRFSGTRTGTSIAVHGSLMEVTFTTDGSNFSNGFSASGYEWGEVLAVNINYRLQATSPTLDLGSAQGAPSTDADGVARPYDGDRSGTAQIDIGAYEWHANLPPQAVGASDLTVLPNTVVNFNGQGSSDPDGTITTWDWDFGDGSPHATMPTTQHTYTATGTYTLRLTVTDDQGSTNTDVATITVANNLPPVANAGPDQHVAPGTLVTLNASASGDPDGTITAYSWSFGDGSPANNGPVVTHTYSESGTFIATLTVTDDRGAIVQDTAIVTVGTPSNRVPMADAGANRIAHLNTPASFDARGSFDTDGTLVAFAWDFGDGQSGTGVQVQHTYADLGTYLVRLTVTDDRGATSEDFLLVTVGPATVPNQPPQARAGDDISGNAGQRLTFSAAASADADGSIVAWQWDFGDGSSASGLSAAHTYEAGGSYVVTLTVIDDKGVRSTDTLQAIINALPAADAGAARAGEVGQDLAFDARSSKDPDGRIASYTWDFGDGSTATGAQATHAYQEPGLYTVRLTVTDNLGARATAQAIASISKPPPTAPLEDGGCSSTQGTGSASVLALSMLMLGLLPRHRRQ
jgi:MYXO-CTERM domain-containing protein